MLNTILFFVNNKNLLTDLSAASSSWGTVISAVNYLFTHYGPEVDSASNRNEYQ